MIQRYLLNSVLLLAVASAPIGAAEYVIHISVDGLHPGHLQTQINAGLAPHFKRFQDEGAWTNNARTDYTHTNTLPNHTAMITGRPVSLPTGMPAMTQHGYTANDNTVPVEETLHNFTSPDWYKASTFDVVHDAGFSTALYVSKDKFKIYEHSYDAADGAPHAYGSDKIDTFVNPNSSALMQPSLLSGLPANNFKYTFVHYDDLDDDGHDSGWGGANYMSAIVDVNNYLGKLFGAIETDPQLAGRTAIVLSADHGGATGTTSHSNVSNSENYTIPFYVWGAGIAHGDLYAFNNGTRTNPSTSRPDYNAAGQPIRNGDGGNLALSLLGLSAIPGSLINASQNLRVALPGDFNLDNAVDTADYVAWSKGVGTAATPGQYDLWRANFGVSLDAASAAQVPVASPIPEPTPRVLATAGMFFMAFYRRWAFQVRRKLLEFHTAQASF
jgi:hypothetical protein